MPPCQRQDPLLLKLNPATVSALNNANIICLEDLFSLTKGEIYGISGIGKKRGREILEMLHSLPFDYLNDALPGNPEQDPYAGVNSTLAEALSSIFYYSDKYLKRGLRYYQNGRVGQINLVDEAKEEYHITVTGSRQYTVKLLLAAGHELHVHCNCPAFAQYYGDDCKHIYAAVLALAEQQRLMRFEVDTGSDYAYRQILRSLKNARSDLSLKNSKELEYMLVQDQSSWSLYPKQVYPLLKAANKRTHNYGNYQWDNPWSDLSPSNPKDRMIVSYLKNMDASNSYYSYGNNNNSNTTYSLGDGLDLLTDRTVYLKEGKKRAAEVRFQQGTLTLLMDIRRAETGQGGLAVEFRLLSEAMELHPNNADIISVDPCWVRDGLTLARLESTDLARKFFLNAARNSIQLPAEKIDSFLEEFYPMLLEADIQVQLSDKLTKQKKLAPESRLYLRENGQQLRIEFRAAYGDYEVQHESRREEILLPAPSGENGEGPLLWSVPRSLGQEEQWAEELQETGLEATGSFRTFIPSEYPLEWVIEDLSKLAEAGFRIYGKKDLQRYAPPRKMTRSTFRVSSGEQWFELEGTMHFGDVAVGMNEIRQVLVNDKPYVRLQDGSTGELPERWLKQLKKLLKLMEPQEGRSREPQISAPVVEELGQTADEYHADEKFNQYAERLREFEDIQPVDPPKQFDGELRPYQRGGLSWMHFLHQYELGGILADDMGLGKTVQVLALLLKIEESTGDRPQSLIIAPRSVLHNWQAEARRFIPGYQTYIHHGTDRAASWDDWPEADISITTYSTMRNDIDLLSERIFDYIVLDESHTIRNPSSKTFRALRNLRGTHRLCLSGTPVQNTTMDLWSQFEFLNPGLLGGTKEVSPDVGQTDRRAKRPRNRTDAA